MPTLLDVARASYPATHHDHRLPPLAGRSLMPAFCGAKPTERTLAWEHEGNRAIRVGDWKLVGVFRGDWELYNLATDRAETINLASSEPEKVRELADRYGTWAASVGVVPWQELPGSNYQPTAAYRKKSEPVPQAP